MTGEDLFKKLRRRLEEADDTTDDGANWSATEKTDAFLVALKTLTASLADNYLSALYTSTTASSSSNEFAVNQILLPDSITSVLVTYTSDVSHGPRYAEIINLKERSTRDNAYMEPTTYDPIAYLTEPSANAGTVKIAVEPSGDIASIQIRHIGEPTEITDDELVEYPLGDETINAFLYLAEGECWRIDNQPNRAGMATQLGVAEIQNLNSRYNPEL